MFKAVVQACCCEVGTYHLVIFTMSKLCRVKDIILTYKPNKLLWGFCHKLAQKTEKRKQCRLKRRMFYVKVCGYNLIRCYYSVTLFLSRVLTNIGILMAMINWGMASPYMDVLMCEQFRLVKWWTGFQDRSYGWRYLLLTTIHRSLHGIIWEQLHKLKVILPPACSIIVETCIHRCSRNYSGWLWDRKLQYFFLTSFHPTPYEQFPRCTSVSNQVHSYQTSYYVLTDPWNLTYMVQRIEAFWSILQKWCTECGLISSQFISVMVCIV